MGTYVKKDANVKTCFSSIYSPRFMCATSKIKQYLEIYNEISLDKMCWSFEETYNCDENNIGKVVTCCVPFLEWCKDTLESQPPKQICCA